MDSCSTENYIFPFIGKKRLPLEVFDQWQKFLEFHWLKAPQNWTKNKWFKSSYLDFIYFRFFGRMSQNQRKLAKRITHFTIQFCPKNLTYFTKLSSLSIVKKSLSNTAKNLSHFTSFTANMFLVYIRKKIYTAPFLNARKLYPQSSWKSNTCIFL